MLAGRAEAVAGRLRSDRVEVFGLLGLSLVAGLLALSAVERPSTVLLLALGGAVAVVFLLRTDLAILVILWVQLTLGLVTLPLSLSHSDGSVMLVLADWAQRVFTFRVGGAEGLVDVAWPYKVHIVLGMTIFLLFPFSRLVHVWSGFASIGYLFRPYQLVRSRRLNVPAGRNVPGQAGTAD